MSEVIINNIKFKNVPDKRYGTKIGDLLTQSNVGMSQTVADYIQSDDFYAIVNGVDIDWNSIEVEDGLVLDTTADLINWIVSIINKIPLVKIISVIFSTEASFPTSEEIQQLLGMSVQDFARYGSKYQYYFYLKKEQKYYFIPAAYYKDNANVITIRGIDDIAELHFHQDYSNGVLSFSEKQAPDLSNYYTKEEVNTMLDGKIDTTLKGAKNGVASLDSTGKVPASQLPSYVDDVIEGYLDNSPLVESFSELNSYRAGNIVLYLGTMYRFKVDHAPGIFTPGEVQKIEQFLQTGEVGKIYTDIFTSKTYRWSGSTYIQISNPYSVDDEDLTVVTNKIKFKDRPNTDGMGKIILRKNMVNGINTLTQSMINKPNTTYVIQYDYDLNGAEITIPANCVLEFDGGSLRNGTIIGNNCSLSGNLSYNIFNDCVIKDFRLSYIDVRWFGASESTETTKIPSADYFQRAYDNALYYHDGVPLVIKGRFYVEKTVNVNTSFAIHGFNAIVSDIPPVNIEQKIPSVIEVAPSITAFDVVGRPYGQGSTTKLSFIDIRDVYLISSGLSSIFADISASGAPSMPGNIFHVEAYFFNKVFNFRRTQQKDTVYAVLSVRCCKMANNNTSFYSYYDGNGVTLCQLHIADSDLEAGGRVYLSNVWGSHIIDNCMLEGQKDTIYFNGNAILTVTNNYFEGNTGIIDIVAFKGLYWSRNYSNGVAANCIVVGGKILKYEDSNPGNYQNLIIRNETVIEDVNFINKTCPYNYVFREYENERYGERIARINFKTLPTIQHKTEIISPSDFSILRSNHYEKSLCGMVYIDELNKEIPLLTLSSGTNYYLNATGLQLEAGDIIVLTFYQTGKINTTLFVDQYRTNVIGRASDYNGFTIYCIKLEEGDYDYNQLHLGFSSSNGGKVSNAVLSVIPKNNTTTKLVECIKIYDDCPLSPASGTFANRPKFDTTIYEVENDGVGFKYFCTDRQTTEGATDGIEIIHKGNDIWVDALGRVVS